MNANEVAFMAFYWPEITLHKSIITAVIINKMIKYVKFFFIINDSFI